jgi:hypothetical protein
MPIARARLEPLLMLHLLQMVMQVVQEALHGYEDVLLKEAVTLACPQPNQLVA